MKAIQSVNIIGGGLGGLALAQALRNSGISFRVFERDDSADSRGQGYAIGLNDDGAAALTKLNRSDLAPLLRTEMKKAFEILDGVTLSSWATIPITKEDSETQDAVIPGLVNRELLRESLTKGIEDRIEWSKKFEKYEEFPDRVVAYFEDGTQFESDLLVAADGCNSRVRAQRCPDLVYENLHITNTFAIIPNLNEERMPNIPKIAKENMLRFMGPNGHTILMFEYASKNGERQYVWSMSHPALDEESDNDSQATILERYIEKSKMFHPEVQAMIEQSPEITATREMHCIKPVNYNPLTPTSRVTLLGDAAHAMTTHRGLGANTTFVDAIELAEALTPTTDCDWKDRVSKYEEVMIKRGFKAVTESKTSTQMIHATGFKSYLTKIIFKLIGTFLSFRKWWFQLK